MIIGQYIESLNDKAEIMFHYICVNVTIMSCVFLPPVWNLSLLYLGV